MGKNFTDGRPGAPDERVCDREPDPRRTRNMTTDRQPLSTINRVRRGGDA